VFVRDDDGRGGSSWWVDPQRGRERGDAWKATHEALGVAVVGGAQHLLTFSEHRRGSTEVHLRRREANKATVVVLDVVPREGMPAVRESVVEAAGEAIGKSGAVFQRF
jgi:hypothetical protein